MASSDDLADYFASNVKEKQSEIQTERILKVLQQRVGSGRSDAYIGDTTLLHLSGQRGPSTKDSVAPFPTEDELRLGEQYASENTLWQSGSGLEDSPKAIRLQPHVLQLAARVFSQMQGATEDQSVIFM